MQYFIAFLEGVITFISPCLLPMIPIYISYFANGDGDRRRTLKNVAGFVAGFTVIFVALGAFAGSIGEFLQQSGAAAYSVNAIPTTYFIDKDGKIISYVQGQLNMRSMEKGIDGIKAELMGLKQNRYVNHF